MSLDFFESVLSQYPRASLLGIVGGEPLLHPRLIDFIRAGEKQRLNVNVSTNGVLLTQDISRRILDTGLSSLNVSLDAPDAAEYLKIRGGSADIFNKILKNIEAFAELKTSRNAPLALAISFVTGKHNLHRISAFAALGKNLGADVVFCQNVLSYRCSELTSGAEALMDLPEIRNQIREMKFPDGIQVVPPSLVPLDADCRCTHCAHPFKMLTFDGAGNLSPCCIIPPHPKYGNLKNNLSAWRNARELQAIRESMITGADAFDDICLDCWERFSMGQPHTH